MSGGEQPGFPSLTCTKAVAHVVEHTEGTSSTNGAREGDPLNEPPPQRAPSRPSHGLPSNVIHELRTPLTSIHGYAQMLQRTLRDDRRTTSSLSVIVRETTRLSAMLAELSELAELEAGEVPVTPIDVDVHHVIEGVVHEITRCDAAGHPIEFEGTAVARCNPTLLSQVLLHVLQNAVRHSPPGSPVEMRVTSPGGKVQIAVADRGIGIDPADEQRIYQPFERGANARLAGVRGLGLGLFLACRALEQASGSIVHEPRVGGGTVFRVTVPGA